MGAPAFDLIDIIRVIKKRKIFIFCVAIAAIAIGLVFFAVKKKKYKSAARILVNNPLYNDRTTLFRSYETRYVDFYGGDDDLDKVTALANSDTVRDRIIRNCQFQDVYKMDINSEKGHAALMFIFAKGFNLKRTEYKDIEISYVAYDAQTAANVANMAVKVLEETYRHYYTVMKQNMYTAISQKMTQLDSTINILTDSLATIRDEYGFYNIVSPTRQNILVSEIKGGKKGFGKAIERIQNLEALKDQFVADRAHYASNLNEFEASQNAAMQYLKVITRALPPTAPTGPDTVTIVVTAGFLGLLFSTIYVLLIAYYKKITELL
jgi:uncharacterized protein involved in exopolysaccharide biosynthesis